MNTKTTLSALITVATLAVGGLAFAQSTTMANPPSSTSGQGCTATANAMRAGNLSANATGKGCTSESASTAAVVAPAPAVVAPAPAVAAQAAPAAPMKSYSMGNTATPAPRAPIRVARADRN